VRFAFATGDGDVAPLNQPRPAAAYFAYGSNMHLPRLREREPSAERLAIGTIRHHRFAWNKLGRDGSAKANLIPAEGATVWGVVFAIDPGDWPVLDRFERDYERRSVLVHTSDDGLRCETYLSNRLVDREVPHEWYRDLVVRGARESELPPDWVEMLASAVPTAGSEPSR
jgi:gamma-glutamylcyclotransferase (GGCT)/AIG2-like uncharacterized protein YtfP